MTLVAFLSLLPLLPFALGLPRSSEASSSGDTGFRSFGLKAVRQGSPIDGIPVHAADHKLFLGVNTKAVPCTAGTPDCPPGYTNFVFNQATTGIDMNSQVPGGQVLYIAKDGSVSYSAGGQAPPAGEVAIRSGWSLQPPPDRKTPGKLSWPVTVTACPVKGRNGVYAVKGRIGSGNYDGCIDFETPAYWNDGYGAYEFL